MLNINILNDVMLTGIALSTIMQIVIVLSVAMLNVAAPFVELKLLFL